MFSRKDWKVYNLTVPIKDVTRIDKNGKWIRNYQTFQPCKVTNLKILAQNFKKPGDSVKKPGDLSGSLLSQWYIKIAFLI